MKISFKRAAAILMLSSSALYLAVSNTTKTGSNEDKAKSETFLRSTIKPPKGWSGLSEPAAVQDGLVIFSDSAQSRNGFWGKKVIAEGGGQTSVLNAMFRYATTGNPDMACMASAIGDLLDDIQKRRNISRADAAVKLIEALSPDQIKNISVEGRTELIAPMISQTDADDPINKSPFPGDAFKALSKIYMNSEEDPAFNTWDAQKQVELTEALRDDPELMQARSKWRKLDENTRLQAMRRIMDLTVKVYGSEFGINPVPVVYIDYSDENVLGMYAPYSRLMLLNRKASEIPEDFNITATVMVHETLHAFHHQLAEKMAQGTIDHGHDIYKYAQFMQESYFRYLSIKYKDYSAYRANPTEKHAWEMQGVGIGSYIGAGANKDSKKIKDNLRKATDAKDNFTRQRDQALEDARISGAQCVPVQVIK